MRLIFCFKRLILTVAFSSSLVLAAELQTETSKQVFFRGGIGARMYAFPQKGINTFISSINEGLGTTGGNLPSNTLRPQFVVGVRFADFFPRMTWDLSFNWIQKDASNMAIKTKLTAFFIEFNPKLFFLSVENPINFYLAPSLGWLTSQGSFSLGSDHHLTFYGNSFLFGGNLGFVVRPLKYMEGMISGGYQRGLIPSIKAHESSGTLFNTFQSEDTILLNEVGKPPQNLTFNFSGWFIATTLLVTL